MQFFIPETSDIKTAEEIYQKIKDFAEQQLGTKPSARRIFSIVINEHGQSLQVEVGKNAPNGEPVIAILDTSSFLICTPTQGVLRGLPAIVGAHEVLSVVEFDS